jgi:hypothetical protein
MLPVFLGSPLGRKAVSLSSWRLHAACLVVLCFSLLAGMQALRHVYFVCNGNFGECRVRRAIERFSILGPRLPRRGTVEYVTDSLFGLYLKHLKEEKKPLFTKICREYLETGAFPENPILGKSVFESILFEQLAVYQSITFAQFAMAPLLINSQTFDYMNDIAFCKCHDSAAPEWIIGDYPGGISEREVPCPEGYAVKQTVEGGLVLYERMR